MLFVLKVYKTLIVNIYYKYEEKLLKKQNIVT